MLYYKESCHLFTGCLTCPGFSVQTTVLDGFSKVFCFYFFFFIQVRNGSGYFQNTVISTGRKI